MTFDINELRRLAQVATPGPWQFWHGWVATEIDKDGGVVIVERPTPSGGKYQTRVDANFKFIAAANPAAISDLLDRLEAAESECLEEARLNGMGSEREAALMAKLEAAEKERAVLKAKVERMEKRLRLILEEPENTMSNSKAMREMLRQARLALEKSK